MVLSMLGIKKFYMETSIFVRDGFIQITIPLGAYELESLNKKHKRNSVE